MVYNLIFVKYLKNPLKNHQLYFPGKNFWRHFAQGCQTYPRILVNQKTSSHSCYQKHWNLATYPWHFVPCCHTMASLGLCCHSCFVLHHFEGWMVFEPGILMSHTRVWFLLWSTLVYFPKQSRENFNINIVCFYIHICLPLQQIWKVIKLKITLMLYNKQIQINDLIKQ